MKELLKKFGEATNNELYDPDYKDGEWMVEAVETHETLENYADSSKVWAEKSTAKSGEIAGFKFLAWAKVQPKKGDARRQVSVVDFGDFRIVLNADLSIFV